MERGHAWQGIAKPKAPKGRDEINAGLLKRGKETDLLGTAPKGRTQVRFLSTLNDIDTLQNVC